MSYQEPTDAQKKRLAQIRKDFGNAIARTYNIDKRTGHMRVKAKCIAGTWLWWFDTNGNLTNKAMQTELTLDTDDADTARSGALPRNAQDDNDT